MTPTRITFGPTEKVSSITVRNEDVKAAEIQIEVMAWSPSSSGDKYNPTHEVLVSPAVFELAPGAEQIVRVGLHVGPDDIERSYRMFLQEVPRKEAASSNNALLRIGIPLFVPPMKQIYELDWSLVPKGGGELDVTVVNVGTVHKQLRGFRILDDTGDVVAEEDIFAYLLLKHARTWSVDSRIAVREQQKVHMEATTDHAVMREMIQVGLPEAHLKPAPGP